MEILFIFQFSLGMYFAVIILKNKITMTKFKNMNRVSVNQKFINIACRNKYLATGNCKSVDRSLSNRLFSTLHYPIILLMLSLVSCSGMGKTAQNETPTRGNIKISVDESFQPLIDTEVFTFTIFIQMQKSNLSINRSMML